MDFEIVYRTFQPLLHSIAYRMLGSITDAEDIVQDVFLNYEQMQKDHITNQKAYLIKMITNHCLNYIHSARKKREVYMGTWLPEPQLSIIEQNPLDLLVSSETMSYALLVLIEQLSAVERAVFILRESLAYDYQEIAGFLDKSEINCRKIYSRAKNKLHYVAPPLHSNTEHVKLVKEFINAAKMGNYDKFIEMLTEDARLVTDGGGKVHAAIFPIVSRSRVLAFLHGVIPKGFLGDDHRLVILNGQLGIVLIKDSQPISTLCFELDFSQKYIQKIYVVSNPDKLHHIALT
jgi:RNA polymerase sigma-70 factor (ECF subfamily)